MSFLDEIKFGKKLKKEIVKSKLVKQKTKRYTKRVYVMRVTLKDEVVHKIGVTGRLLKKRLFEIADSFYSAYGYNPMIEVIRGDKKNHRIEGFIEMETHLLALYKHTQVKWQKAFNGSSEFRRVDEDKLLIEYDKAIKEYAKVKEPEYNIPIAW